MADSKLGALLIALKDQDKSNPHGLESKKGKLAILLGADKGEPEDDNQDGTMELESAMQDLCTAINSKDYKAMAQAFMDAHEICCHMEKEPSEDEDQDLAIYDHPTTPAP